MNSGSPFISQGFRFTIQYFLPFNHVVGIVEKIRQRDGEPIQANKMEISGAITRLFQFHGQSWIRGQNLRDRDKTLTPRDQNLKQKVDTRPRFEGAETKTRHETFGIKGSQKVVNILNVNRICEIPTIFFHLAECSKP